MIALVIILLSLCSIVLLVFISAKYYHNKDKDFLHLYSQDELEEFDEWRNNYLKNRHWHHFI